MDREIVDLQHRTPFVIPVSRNAVDRNRAFLGAGVNPDVRVTEDDWWLLQLAIERDFHQSAELLINHGTDINRRLHYMTTLLHHVVLWNSYEPLGLIIRKDANLEVVDRLDRTLLVYAVQSNKMRKVRILLEADVNSIAMTEDEANAFSERFNYLM